MRGFWDGLKRVAKNKGTYDIPWEIMDLYIWMHIGTPPTVTRQQSAIDKYNLVQLLQVEAAKSEYKPPESKQGRNSGNSHRVTGTFNHDG